jgi:hypothetical protein
MSAPRPWWERWDELSPEQQETIRQVGGGEMTVDEGNTRLRRIREGTENTT